MILPALIRPGKLLLASFLLLSPLHSFAQGYVVIHEVMAANENKDNLADEINEFGHSSDWVELYNPSPVDVDLYGYSLIKGSITNITQRLIFTNHLIMPPDTYFRIWCDHDNTNQVGITAYHTGFTLERSNGDTLFLLVPEGWPDDMVTFGQQIPDLTIGRDPVWHYYWQLCIPTPGPVEVPSFWVPNEPSEMGDPFQLRINEWCPTNWNWWLRRLQDPTADTNCGSCYDDWIELYNPSTNPVVLAWWVDWQDPRSLCLSTNAPWTPALSRPFVPFSYIAPKGHLRFWAVGNKRNLNAEELNIKLSHRRGDYITLTAADGLTPIHSVSMQPQGAVTWVETNSITSTATNLTWNVQGLLPDGNTNNIVSFAVVLTNNVLTVNQSTPGEANVLPLTNVVINEILAHSHLPLQDAVEIFNPSPTFVDLSGFWLSDSKTDPQKFRIPPGTIIAPFGFHVFYEYQFNPDGTTTNRSFAFNGGRGDDCYIFGASNDLAGTLTGYRSGAEFGPSENGVSFGRHVNSAGEIEMVAMSRLSFGSIIDSTYPPTWVNSNAFVRGVGQSNYPPKVGPVIISEIRSGTWPYIELYNVSTNVVNLWDTNYYLRTPWGIQGHMVYELPSGLSLGPGQFMLLLDFNPSATSASNWVAQFRTNYHLPVQFTNLFGGFQVPRENSASGLQLYKPDEPGSDPDPGYVPRVIVEQVDFQNWNMGRTNRSEFCLQRIVPDAYGNDPTNWCVAAPAPGRVKNFRFHSISRSNSTAILIWSNVWAGTGFTVQYCESLQGTNTQASVWIDLIEVPPQETTGSRIVSDDIPSGINRFYRTVYNFQ